MKVLIVGLCVLVAVSVARPEEKYTDKYDNFNYKEVIENDRLLSGYSSCLLDEGPCTPEGKELKSHIKEAMENKCALCTDKQKEGTEEVITYLIKKKPDIWNKLADKYDPTGKYREENKDKIQEIMNKN